MMDPEHKHEENSLNYNSFVLLYSNIKVQANSLLLVLMSCVVLWDFQVTTVACFDASPMETYAHTATATTVPIEPLCLPSPQCVVLQAYFMFIWSYMYVHSNCY